MIRHSWVYNTEETCFYIYEFLEIVIYFLVTVSWMNGSIHNSITIARIQRDYDYTGNSFISLVITVINLLWCKTKIADLFYETFSDVESWWQIQHSHLFMTDNILAVPRKYFFQDFQVILKHSLQNYLNKMFPWYYMHNDMFSMSNSLTTE